MTKQEAYEKATVELLSDPKGTRMDIIFRAMEIYSESNSRGDVKILLDAFKKIREIFYENWDGNELCRAIGKIMDEALSSYQSSTGEQKQESAAITAGESMKEHAVGFAEWKDNNFIRSVRKGKLDKYYNRSDDGKINGLLIYRTIPELYELWPERNQSPESLPAEQGDAVDWYKDVAPFHKFITDNYALHEGEENLYHEIHRVSKPYTIQQLYSLFKGRPLTQKPEDVGSQMIAISDLLRQINEICGTVNFSSHNQMREAIESTVELSNQAIEKLKTNQ